jgi:hypothetical protein
MADCFESVQACMLRAAKLNPNGSPKAGATNLYVSDAVIDVGINMQITKGTKKQVKNGCGAICATLTQDDTIDGADLTLTLCQLDAELIALLTGATVVPEPNLGLEFPAPGSTLGDGASLEIWSLAWDNDEQAVDGADLLYFHWVFPKTKWIIGNTKIDENILQVPLTGQCFANSQFADGPENDLPEDFSWIGVFKDTEIPAASCALQPVPAQS